MARFHLPTTLTVLALSCIAFAGEGEGTRKPNIVLIMADDMGYSDLGCYGSEIETPNLDQLASGGLRYSQMYNTSKCNPSRASLLTGHYATERRWRGPYNWGPTLGEVLKEGGYRTLWSGKNHSEIRPPQRGFDRFYGFQGGACNYWNPGSKTRDGKSFPRLSNYTWMVNDQWIDDFIPEDPDYYMTDAITDAALEWLDEYKSEDKPYFLYIAYNAPHWPLHARDKDIAKYEGVYDVGYQEIRKARYKQMIEQGIIDPKTAPLHPEDIKDWNSLGENEKKEEALRMRVHAAMVDCLDQNIGRIINKVKEQGEFDNTLFLFLSDNGASQERDRRAYKKRKLSGKLSGKLGGIMSYECIGPDWARVANTPLAKHKVTSHEGGVCTLMIAHWPAGITSKGGWYHEPAHLVDFMCTFLDLSGQTYLTAFNRRKTKPLQGISLVPSFRDESLAERPWPIGYQFKYCKGIRTKQRKLVKFKDDEWELYDMFADRTETKNLADQMPEKVQEMTRLFGDWYAMCLGQSTK